MTLKCMCCKGNMKDDRSKAICKRCRSGFNCETCGMWHKFDAYVYAHTRDLLQHTCKWCGAEHSIIMLSASQTKQGKLDD